MKIIHGIELKEGSREEVLPDFSPDFPHIVSCVELDKHAGRRSPWHWHKEIECFYIVQGELKYNTPQGETFFSAGSGGIVNSNILHMSKVKEGVKTVTAFLHLFDPLLISGHRGSLIDQKYVLPFVTSPTEIVGLYPQNPEHAPILDGLARSFQLSEKDYAYEIQIRSAISELWYRMLPIAMPLDRKHTGANQANDKLKTMMAFIHERYTEKISVAEIAAAAYISERECFRLFQDHLKTTPVAYVIGYRLQKACHMLTETEEPITSICASCGLGSSSYFGKLFRREMGCSPHEYRRNWRDKNKNWRE